MTIPTASYASEHTLAPVPRVLTIAGTDPTGGAGAQADIKSITVAGGFALSAITALVSQNTTGVRDIYEPDAHVLHTQLEAISDDVTLDGVKIGMLSNTSYIAVVHQWLEEHAPEVVVIDPVMVATSGDRLLNPDAENALKALLPLASIITPNIDELDVLVGNKPGTIRTHEEAVAASQHLAAQYGCLVMVKGGSLDSRVVTNAIVDADSEKARAICPRVATTCTHGTGCSISSALATRLARKDSLQDALSWVTQWLYNSLSHASDLHIGHGHGPVDHSYDMRLAEVSMRCCPLTHQTMVLPDLHGVPDIRGDAGRCSDKPPQHITPPGWWTAYMWKLAEPIMRAMYASPFIRQLADGTLSPLEFTIYQRQDALYLEQYGRVLAMLGAKAHNRDEIAYWGNSAAHAILDEQALHREWMEHVSRDVAAHWLSQPMSPVTEGYTDFLLARANDDYVVGAAATLACCWLYCEIGQELAASDSPDHPYHDWLHVYADPEFLTLTTTFLSIIEHHMEEASADQRERAVRAFIAAAEWEKAFFDQAHLMVE